MHASKNFTFLSPSYDRSVWATSSRISSCSSGWWDRANRKKERTVAVVSWPANWKISAWARISPFRSGYFLPRKCPYFCHSFCSGELFGIVDYFFGHQGNQIFLASLFSILNDVRDHISEKYISRVWIAGHVELETKPFWKHHRFHCYKLFYF